MTQERLNNCIAEELNKWQPILEYGRIYLDEDKALRDKYRWLIWIKTCWPWSFGLTIIDTAEISIGSTAKGVHRQLEKQVSEALSNSGSTLWKIIAIIAAIAFFAVLLFK